MTTTPDMIVKRMALNPQQAAVARHLHGPALVVAGAGTGKTRVIAARAAALVAAGIAPERMLILTFTRRAAEEMKNRVAAACGLPPERLEWCGTFHAMGARCLRFFGRPIGVSTDFTILDETDSQSMLGMILRERCSSEEERRNMPKKAQLAAIYSWARNRMQSWEEAIVEFTGEKFTDVIPSIIELFEEYIRRKTASNVLDYDDLLLKWLELIQRDGEYIRSLYQHVMVDEYQDTNPLQARILEELAGGHRNIMVVGDDAQAIYGFRGADVENIYRFEKTFPDAVRFPLEENYRSTQSILDFANALIEEAPRAFRKHLFTTRAGQGDPPELWVPWSEEEQAERIAMDVYSAWTIDRLPLRNQAVLFRAGYHSFHLEMILRHHNIPFRKFGGPRLTEAAHIRDALAFLRCRENPLDESAWRRILELFPGVGPATSGRIVRTLTRGRPDAREILRRLDALSWPRRAAATGAAFRDLMHRLYAGDRPPADDLAIILEFYEPLLRDKYNFPESRMAALQELRTLAADFEDRRTFLQEVLIGDDTFVEAESPDGQAEYLTLSTIHSAKGREWDVVYILNVVEGCIPVPFGKRDVRIEEERRLLYVAVTRPRRRLVLCVPRMRRVNRNGFIDREFTELSRFLTPRVLEHCTIEGDQELPGTDPEIAYDYGEELGTDDDDF